MVQGCEIFVGAAQLGNRPMPPSDHDDVNNAERPSKRARTEEPIRITDEDFDEYEEQEVAEPVKASDLYLDTVCVTSVTSNRYNFFICFLD